MISNCVSPSFSEATTETVAQKFQNSRATVVKTTTGQTNAGEAGGQDEEQHQSQDQPNPPNYSAFTIKN